MFVPEDIYPVVVKRWSSLKTLELDRGGRRMDSVSAYCGEHIIRRHRIRQEKLTLGSTKVAGSLEQSRECFVKKEWPSTMLRLFRDLRFAFLLFLKSRSAVDSRACD